MKNTKDLPIYGHLRQEIREIAEGIYERTLDPCHIEEILMTLIEDDKIYFAVKNTVSEWVNDNPETDNVVCDQCGGSGEGGTVTTPCYTCNGKGEVYGDE